MIRTAAIVLVAASIVLVAMTLFSQHMQGKQVHYIRCWYPDGDSAYAGPAFGQIRSQGHAITFDAGPDEGELMLSGFSCVVSPPRDPSR